MLTPEDIRREAGRIVQCEYSLGELYILAANRDYILRVTPTGSAADVLAQMDARVLPGATPAEMEA